MTDTDRMVAWLRGKLDEAQQVALAAADGGSGEWFMGAKWNVYRADDQTPHDDQETNELVVYGNVKSQSEHIALHDPAAVLRRIAADRKLLELHPSTTEIINPGYGKPIADFGCVTCHDWDGVTEGYGYCPTVRALAEGYGWKDDQK